MWPWELYLVFLISYGNIAIILILNLGLIIYFWYSVLRYSNSTYSILLILLQSSYLYYIHICMDIFWCWYLIWKLQFPLSCKVLLCQCLYIYESIYYMCVGRLTKFNKYWKPVLNLQSYIFGKTVLWSCWFIDLVLLY